MKFTLQGGEFPYTLQNNYFVKQPLKYISYPTKPHPESLNQVFSNLQTWLSGKNAGILLKMEAPSHTSDRVVAQFFTNDILKHEVDMVMVCERIVQGEWDNFVRTLEQDLKNAGINFL